MKLGNASTEERSENYYLTKHGSVHGTPRQIPFSPLAQSTVIAFE